jgi:protein involved in polysaccharide export with SLBB domain
VEWNTNYDAAMLRAGRCPTALDSTHCERHLRPDYVIDPPDVLSLEVQADGADPAVIEAVNGEHVVKPDGDIDLGETLGNFQIGGTTLAESPARIQEFLKARLPDAKVSVSVASQNSKVYYVITEGMDDGDLVARFPLSSDETVRDALRQMSDLDLADKKIWIARPVCDMSGPDEILTVDAVEVMAGEETESNYSLNPGDRIFVTSTRGFWQSVDDVLSGSWISLRKVFDDSADTTVNAFPFPTDEE